MSTDVARPPASFAERERRIAARADGAPAGGGINRRTFLEAAPRHLLHRVRALLTDLQGLTSSVSVGQARSATRRIAILDVSRCLAWGTEGCQLCYLQCPLRDRAIVLEGGKPTIVSSVCTGCGLCGDVCRSVNDVGAMQFVDAPSCEAVEDDR